MEAIIALLIINLLTNLKNMATVQELEAKVDALITKSAEEKEQVLTAVNGLKTTIQELKDVITNQPTPEQLQVIADKLDTAIGSVENIYTPEATTDTSEG